jgi:hypothetical protein
MSKTLPHSADPSFLEKAGLLKLKLKAMRAGVWFKTLPRIDRVLVDLTIRIAGNVRSFILAKNLLAVIRKLEGVMENRFLCAVREVGFPLARRLSLIAQKWGNRSAKRWECDKDFARYLTAASFNEPKIFSG